jgi:hypothetical protein
MLRFSLVEEFCLISVWVMFFMQGTGTGQLFDGEKVGLGATGQAREIRGGQCGVRRAARQIWDEEIASSWTVHRGSVMDRMVRIIT